MDRPRPSILDDRDIIARVLAGERQCFHVLVERHSGPLLATLSLALGNPEDAREVFQETWLRALERLDTLRDADRLHSWLVSIALNHVRARSRRSTFFPQRAEDEPVVAIHEGDVGERLAEHEEQELLRQRMRALPARQREVMDLRVNHGLSHAEIAALLEISEESSRANYYQALRRLRAAFHVETERT